MRKIKISQEYVTEIQKLESGQISKDTLANAVPQLMCSQFQTIFKEQETNFSHVICTALNLER